ncbi:ABC transporter permease [Ructibacterium gallinarum]|uniref:Sugar ABC transporter permease n=1 Tax=Ructibacterium gallinarum TaxID=2779355 RepID=A0A9D5LZP5_9FIRM|nr:ABC transporter permease subunit [Ructibacterium gallinarum]MBE5041028.1 sugar ABC transporter permease [Ructibacterium gallinarum]
MLKKEVSLKGNSFAVRVKKDFLRNKYVYLMAIPVLLYYIAFCYMPMYGAIIAFKNYKIVDGILGSEWVGLQWFIKFINDYSFVRVLKNTVLLSFFSILWTFPAPIIFALFLNEIRSNKYKRVVQTLTYLPHFISLVVICGLIVQFVGRDGMITSILVNVFGMERTNLLADPAKFRTIYILSELWQGIGWNSIIYLSALSAIDLQLYEAAELDGAGRWRKMFHITIPSIVPTIIIMLILKLGHFMTIGYEKVMLLYSPNIYETADIISTYVYRIGLLEGAQYSYSTAIGLFNSIINVMILIIANKISNKVTGQGLW